MPDLKSELHDSLRAARATNLQKAAGLSEYDLRRPLTASGTNILGVLKHLGGMEYGYLGEAFGRGLSREIPGDEDLPGAADLWARPDETSSYILDWYHQSCTNADETIALYDLDSPGWVEHFAEGHQTTTLSAMILRVLNEELPTAATSTSSANSSTAPPAGATFPSTPPSTSPRSRQQQPLSRRLNHASSH